MPKASSTRLADICSSKHHVKLAFITPFPPRHDGLAQYSANLRTALVAQCTNLQVGGSSCLCSQYVAFVERERSVCRVYLAGGCFCSGA